MRGLDPGAERDRGQPLAGQHLREYRKAAARTVAHHLGQRRAAQPAPRRKQRDRLQYIGLAGAIVAVERDEPRPGRSEEHTSELQSLMRISYAVFCLKQKK